MEIATELVAGSGIMIYHPESHNGIMTIAAYIEMDLGRLTRAGDGTWSATDYSGRYLGSARSVQELIANLGW